MALRLIIAVHWWDALARVRVKAHTEPNQEAAHNNNPCRLAPRGSTIPRTRISLHLMTETPLGLILHFKLGAQFISKVRSRSLDIRREQMIRSVCHYLKYLFDFKKSYFLRKFTKLVVNIAGRKRKRKKLQPHEAMISIQTRRYFRINKGLPIFRYWAAFP
jgi:hypothetical protein